MNGKGHSDKVSGMTNRFLGNGILCHKVARKLSKFCSHSSVSWEVGPVNDKLGVLTSFLAKCC